MGSETKVENHVPPKSAQDGAGLDFETSLLTALLRDQATASIDKRFKTRTGHPSLEGELEKLESLWEICLDFLIRNLPQHLREKSRKDAPYPGSVLRTAKEVAWSAKESPDSIVLLVLRPSDTPSSAIRCDLCTARLSRQPCPSYDVLSHAWGDPFKTRRIIINGTVAKVTETLESALRHLRHPTAPRVLWVDALCIDEPGARGCQWQYGVQGVRVIYSKAKEVLVWLGDESNTSAAALAFLGAFASFPKHQQNITLPRAFLEPTLVRSLEAVLNLLRRPWWDRAGLLQDLMRGCKINVYCGSKSLDWDIFVQFFRALHKQGPTISRQFTQYKSQISHLPYLVPTGSVGYFPSAQSLSRGMELPSIVEALCSSTEMMFARPNTSLSWVLAMARIGSYLGPMLTHLAVRLCRNGAEHRQTALSRALELGERGETEDSAGNGPEKSTAEEFRNAKRRLLHMLKSSEREIGRIISAYAEPNEKHCQISSADGGIDDGVSLQLWMRILERLQAPSNPDCIIQLTGTNSGDHACSRDLERGIDENPADSNGPLNAKTSMTKLLLLHPNDDSKSAVHCDMISMDLAIISALGVERGPYYAFSHIWRQDEDCTENVYLNGMQKQVSPTLFSVLRCLRDPKLPVLLWVNALGVTLESTRAAARQAGLKSIFGMAGHVLILGDREEVSKFDPDMAEPDVLSLLMQFLGPPQTAMEQRSPIGLPVIMPPKLLGKTAGNETKWYPYQPLPSTRSLRVLRLFPLEKAETEEDKYRLIKCSMETIDLDEFPVYDALSYTWGDPLTFHMEPEQVLPPSEWYRPAFQIECDGHTVSVTANLYAALVAIRWVASLEDRPDFKNEMHQARVQRSRHLWVDALCINQQDLDERGAQVALMSLIYKQARSVVIWLGGEDEAAQDALQMMHLIVQKALTNIQGFETARSMSITDENTYKILGLPRFTIRQWIRLYAFLNRAWFKRAWVIQEIAWAKNTTLFCGLKMFGADLPILTVIALYRSQWTSQLEFWAANAVLNLSEKPATISQLTARSVQRLYKQGIHPLDAGIFVFFVMQDLKASLGTAQGAIRSKPGVKPYRLSTNVSLLRATQATDPRDKVYAFMSISAEFVDGACRVKGATLTASYRKTARDVFIDAARFMLVSNNNLELLSLVQDPESTLTPNLPSWVPDLSVQDSAMPFDFGFPQPFTASEGLGRASITFPSPNLLEIRGFCMGTVAATGRLRPSFLVHSLAELFAGLPSDSAIAGPRMSPNLRRFILESEQYDIENDRTIRLAALDTSGAVTHQHKFEVFWRTLIGDFAAGHHPAPSEYGTAVRHLFQKAINKLQVEVRNMLVEKDSSKNEIAEKLDVLASEYTALRQLLSDTPETVSRGLPPELQQFLEVTASPGSAAFETAELEHDWALAGSLGDINEGIVAEVEGIVENRNAHRCLFRTSNGNLGLGAPSVSVGDEVWYVIADIFPHSIPQLDWEKAN
ncbi:hypothetical protein DL767_001472 [Monosporascus sp. MG133]|nr:hypothetical protein DL767_001472 [Monosporascus sp. MG133]